MKPQTPMDDLSKAGLRRRLQRDVRRYQKAGGRIQQLASGRARDLCQVGLNDIEQLCGFRCEW